jgi:hypothetical protein
MNFARFFFRMDLPWILALLWREYFWKCIMESMKRKHNSSKVFSISYPFSFPISALETCVSFAARSFELRILPIEIFSFGTRLCFRQICLWCRCKWCSQSKHPANTETCAFELCHISCFYVGGRISTHKTVVDLRKIPPGIPRRRWETVMINCPKRSIMWRQRLFSQSYHTTQLLCSQHKD